MECLKVDETPRNELKDNDSDSSDDNEEYEKLKKK